MRSGCAGKRSPARRCPTHERPDAAGAGLCGSAQRGAGGDDPLHGRHARRAPALSRGGGPASSAATRGPPAPGSRPSVSPRRSRASTRAIPQLIDAGSYVIVERPEAFGGLTRFTLQAFIQPTRVPIRPEPRRQVIMGTWAEDRAGGFALLLDETGALALLVGSGPAAALVSTRVPLTSRRWYHVAASVDLAAGTVSLRQTPLADHTPSLERPVAVTAPVRADGAAGGRALPGRRAPRRRGRPSPDLLALQWQDRPPPALGPRPDPGRARGGGGGAEPGVPDADAIAIWDLAADIATVQVTDRSPHRLHGRTVNAPKRAVTGHNWDGSEMDWRRAPEQYGAIHFHDDDLHDAGWTPSLTLTVPAEDAQRRLRAPARGGRGPGVLGGVLRAAAASAGPGRAWPSSPPPRPTSPTRTTARACARARPSSTSARCPSSTPPTCLLMHHPELGGSTYDTHSDGSGVCHVSRLRPIVNTRPTGWLWNLFLDFVPARLARGRGAAVRRRHRRRSPRRGRGPPRGLRGGADRLPPRVLLPRDAGRAGSPSRRRRAAHVHGRQRLLLARLVSGRATRPARGAAGRGRHPRLGGGGRRVLPQLHRRVRRDVAAAGPRPERARRAWASSPRASTARRTTAAPPPAATRGRASSSRAIEDEILGDFGTAGSGAAGLELDAFNASLGSPAHALVVASSEDHSNAFQLVNEEMNVSFAGSDGRFSPRCARTWSSSSIPAAGRSSPPAPSPTSGAWRTRATTTTSPASRGTSCAASWIPRPSRRRRMAKRAGSSAG